MRLAMWIKYLFVQVNGTILNFEGSVSVQPLQDIRARRVNNGASIANSSVRSRPPSATHLEDPVPYLTRIGYCLYENTYFIIRSLY